MLSAICKIVEDCTLFFLTINIYPAFYSCELEVFYKKTYSVILRRIIVVSKIPIRFRQIKARLYMPIDCVCNSIVRYICVVVFSYLTTTKKRAGRLDRHLLRAPARTLHVYNLSPRAPVLSSRCLHTCSHTLTCNTLYIRNYE